jgi:post-segregation antitoxin (ccd killing protein)
MASNGKPQSVNNIFSQQSNGAVDERLQRFGGQDKDRISSDRVASAQPASVNHIPRSHPTNSNSTRTQSPLVHKSRTEHLNVWVDPLVKSELERLAAQDGLSVSATAAAFLQKALQQHVDLAYSALLEPIITSAIHKELQGMSSRQAWLLTRNVFASEHTRNLVTNILGLLGRQQKMSEENLKNIIAMTKQTKGNLTRRNPELEELIEAVRKWLEEGEETHG